MEEPVGQVSVAMRLWRSVEEAIVAVGGRLACSALPYTVFSLNYGWAKKDDTSVRPAPIHPTADSAIIA
jgi:hypothetical protein